MGLHDELHLTQIGALSRIASKKAVVCVLREALDVLGMIFLNGRALFQESGEITDRRDGLLQAVKEGSQTDLWHASAADWMDVHVQGDDSHQIIGLGQSRDSHDLGPT